MNQVDALAFREVCERIHGGEFSAESECEACRAGYDRFVQLDEAIDAAAAALYLQARLYSDLELSTGVMSDEIKFHLRLALEAAFVAHEGN